MGDFRRLIAWQKANAYAIAVHTAFSGRRSSASTGSRGQILRAVSSIADNLAEGCGRQSRSELARYAESAYSSAKEVENQLIRSRALGIVSPGLAADLLRQGDEVARLCFGLFRGRTGDSLRNDDGPKPRSKRDRPTSKRPRRDADSV